VHRLKAIDDKDNVNVNFYEKLPVIENKVKRTLKRLDNTKEYYNKMKKIFFGYK